ncbi:MAG: ATP-binding cassette domain-containing protein [Marinilabiliales bacterium]|nr:MAG: ATP-binding cassette domain-containing protein [Marinilabiliales bacterium]
MIEVRHINKSFDGQQVLNDISVSFEQGKTNLIIGRSGSGKTVLLKCIVGLLEADSGDILYSGQCFTSMTRNEKQKIRQRFGMLFQGAALFDSLNVEENVRFKLDMFTTMTPKEKRERVDFCLRRVNLEGKNRLYPSELSGGMKKRVAIARAIVLNPRYLFCDEPNSGLDPQTAIMIDKLISEITKEFNMTTLVNTHDLNSVMEIGEKVVYIHEGNLWWEGTREEILETDNSKLNDFVFATRIVKQLKKLDDI